MTPPSDTLGPLGRPTAYAEHYAPALLHPVSRAPQRAALGTGAAAPFMGADLWTAYELSWLNPRGKPVVAMAHFTVPSESPCIVESKSLKLYLNSFNQTVFAGPEAVVECLRRDLAAVVWQGHPQGGTVGVRLLLPHDMVNERVEPLAGLSLDRLDVDCHQYTPSPDCLVADATQAPVTEVLVSDLLKSNCLVTGQPDWASVQIAYTGAPIDQAGLLRYLVSFRQHHEFHEHCVERLFMDIWARCKPLKLSVYARYTRRGGLDISPWRTSFPQRVPHPVRTPRQ